VCELVLEVGHGSIVAESARPEVTGSSASVCTGPPGTQNRVNTGAGLGSPQVMPHQGRLTPVQQVLGRLRGGMRGNEAI
jgi:hypothetical protein